MPHASHAFVLQTHGIRPVSIGEIGSRRCPINRISVLHSFSTNQGTIFTKRRQRFAERPCLSQRVSFTNKWNLKAISRNTDYQQNEENTHDYISSSTRSNAVMGRTFVKPMTTPFQDVEINELDRDSTTKLEPTIPLWLTSSMIRRLNSSFTIISQLHQHETSKTSASFNQLRYNENRMSMPQNENNQQRHIPIIALFCVSAIGLAFCMASISTLSLFLEGRKSLVRFIRHFFQTKLPGRCVAKCLVTMCQKLFISTALFLTAGLASLRLKPQRNGQFGFDSF